jgi:multiple sugar transport system ATP-binding protein
VEFVEELGSEAFLYCIADGTDTEVVARTDGLSVLQSGDKVSLVPRPSGLHLFDTRSGARLPD